MTGWHQGVRISNSLLASDHNLDATIVQSKLHILNTQKKTPTTKTTTKQNIQILPVNDPVHMVPTVSLPTPLPTVTPPNCEICSAMDLQTPASHFVNATK